MGGRLRGSPCSPQYGDREKQAEVKVAFLKGKSSEWWAKDLRKSTPESTEDAGTKQNQRSEHRRSTKGLQPFGRHLFRKADEYW